MHGDKVYQMGIWTLERVSKQGKYVSWSPQIVSAATQGCGLIISHTGGGLPPWKPYNARNDCCAIWPPGDQFVNCKYIVKISQNYIFYNGNIKTFFFYNCNIKMRKRETNVEIK